MAAGYRGLNELTTVQATQGLAAYLEQSFPDAAEGGVAIGWDHRAAGSLNSERLALLAAEVLLRRGIRVVLLPGLVPTPLVSYCVVKQRCKAGIMVTASHNPKQDNGYKVFWDHGAQITAPHDAGIAAAIEANRAPWAKYGSFGSLEALLEALGGGGARGGAHTEEVAAGYFDQVGRELCRHRALNGASGLRLVYTPMHGVGAPWVERAFAAFGLPPPLVVEAQRRPDPAFPTVAFPNPEEGAGALELGFATAAKHGATLVLANDPDADRLAVAERQAGGVWRVLTGNEIGVLLADWEWQQYRRRRGTQVASRPAAMLSTTVSSKMLRALAQAEGFHWEEKLTGFKWLCKRAAELRAAGHEVLLCYEEAIGFCVGGVVNDKDGVSAAAVFAEMAASLAREHGRSVCDHLEALYRRTGQYVQNNGYVICREPETTAAIFERLRAGGKYWLRLNEKLRIEGVRDLTTGVDTDAPDGRATLPLQPSSHMITYRFANGATATLRGSGTEPKIKWYAEMEGTVREATEAQLQGLVDALISEMLRPTENGLEMRN